MTLHRIKFLLFVLFCAFCVFSAHATVSLFSDYGQIQNVQNYSSNPFWSPTAPYNQRLPQPVYATGPDLNADDCIKVVQSLVSVQCMARDNCKSTSLSDIRPTIMVQLSNLPGANYVSACSGYIDGIFESYQQQYGNSLPNRPTAFPNATTPNPSVNDSGGIQFENPYKIQPEKWQIEQKERADELQRLQSQNGAGSEHLSKTDFPATYADLSFSERLENDRESLMPYKDASAYRTLDVKSESEWCEGEHANAPECAKYRAKKEAAAQANSTNQQGGTNNTTNNQDNNNNDDDDETAEPEPESTSGLCVENNKFDLKTTADTIFENIQVHTPEVAQKLAQEYVNCSTEPTLTVSSNYTKHGNDDIFNVNKKDGTTVYKVRFDDVKESNGQKFGIDTIKALCLITNSVVSKVRCPRDSGTCFQHCTGMNQKQFSEVSKLIQELLGPVGEKFKGWGKWCYKATFKSNEQLLDYAIWQGSCTNEIVIQ